MSCAPPNCPSNFSLTTAATISAQLFPAVILHSATTIATNYWANHLGCTPEELFSQPLLIVTHSDELRGCDGVVALFRGNAAIVSIPPEREKQLRAAISRTAGDFSPAGLAAALAPVSQVVIGPASIAYASRVIPPAHAVRELHAEDTSARRALAQACTSEEWEHGGCGGTDPASGIFVENHLVSLASFEVWGGNIAHVSVITHPAHRNRGYGRSVVAHLARRALGTGLLPQYRTLETNGPSLRIGTSLGFQSYARSLAIRLLPPSTDLPHERS
jgi:GNAT superfamily N-acetyltransferase